MLPSVDPRIAYAATMTLAVVACSLLLRRSQRSLPLPATHKLALGAAAFCGAMLGAKLPFLLLRHELGTGWGAWFAHGKTILGGIVGGYLAVEVAKWTLDIRIKTGDTFAAPVAIAVAIGRFACFQGGCCYGTPTNLPWGIIFPTATDSPELPRHPTQLYEAAFHAAAAITLIALRRRDIWRGQLLKAYLLAYCVYRFVSEFWRPEPRLDEFLTAYQWVALALLPILAWLWRLDARSLRATPPSLPNPSDIRGE